MLVINIMMTDQISGGSGLDHQEKCSSSSGILDTVIKPQVDAANID